MVKQIISGVQDQKDIGSDIKFFMFNKNSPVRKTLWLAMAAIIGVGLVWYDFNQRSHMSEVIESQAKLIAELKVAKTHEVAVANTQVGLSNSAVEQIAKLNELKRDSDELIAKLNNEYEFKLAAAKKLDNEIDRMRATALAEIELVDSQFKNAGGKTTVTSHTQLQVASYTVDVGDEKLGVNLSTLPTVSHTNVNKVSSNKTYKKHKVVHKPKYTKVGVATKKDKTPKMKTYPNKKKNRIVKTEITDPLVNKTFESTKSYREFWENKLWASAEKITRV